jgi:hypothetical protein
MSTLTPDYSNFLLIQAIEVKDNGINFLLEGFNLISKTPHLRQNLCALLIS